jgi:hypothetical protein
MKKNLTAKVRRTSFTRLSSDALSTFAHGVVTATKGVEAYKPFTELTAELETAVNKLDILLAERYNAGKLEAQKRIIAVDAVLQILQQYAIQMDAAAKSDLDYIVNAGFQVIAGGGAHRPVLLQVPNIKSLKSTAVPGQIEILLAECRGARSFAFEFSYDNGTVWHNGTYSSKKTQSFYRRYQR